MYQSFEVTARPEQGPPRLAALREVLEAEGLDGFLVPRADVHQGEYVAAHDERLAWDVLEHVEQRRAEPFQCGGQLSAAGRALAACP